MTGAVELLFWPLIVSLVLVGIHCQFGLHVLRRNVVFVDLALAQCAALGATVAFMQGHLPQSVGAYAWSLGFAWGAAVLLSLIRFAPPRIPPEALVGVIYVVAAAAALLLIEKAPQGAEHLKQILTGSVLTVGADELGRIVPIYAGIGATLALAGRYGWLRHAGMAGWLADLGFYAAFGLVVTSSVALAGVLLVFSFLIIPALIGLLWADRARRQLAIGWSVGAAAAALGLLGSYWLDASTGAAMVCAFGLALALALLGRALAGRVGALRRARRLMGHALAGLLLVSAAWLVAKPRADQPLLDVVERLWPQVRAGYFNADESEIYADAERYGARYARELERLRGIEADSRWQAATPDDELVRKISSFQQSYNEMIRGERFVMQETRARARERLRGPVVTFLFVTLGAFGLRWFGRRHRAAMRQPRPAQATIASR